MFINSQRSFCHPHSYIGGFPERHHLSYWGPTGLRGNWGRLCFCPERRTCKGHAKVTGAETDRPTKGPPPPSAWVETQPGSGARRGIFRIFGGSLFMENLGPQAALMGINDKTFLGIHIHWEHHRTPN